MSCDARSLVINLVINQSVRRNNNGSCPAVQGMNCPNKRLPFVYVCAHSNDRSVRLAVAGVWY